jgi:hypothetical protein
MKSIQHIRERGGGRNETESRHPPRASQGMHEEDELTQSLRSSVGRRVPLERSTSTKSEGRLSDAGGGGARLSRGSEKSGLAPEAGGAGAPPRLSRSSSAKGRAAPPMVGPARNVYPPVMSGTNHGITGKWIFIGLA